MAASQAAISALNGSSVVVVVVVVVNVVVVPVNSVVVEVVVVTVVVVVVTVVVVVSIGHLQPVQSLFWLASKKWHVKPEFASVSQLSTWQPSSAQMHAEQSHANSSMSEQEYPNWAKQSHGQPSQVPS